jgi:peptide/nickel transport system permease protein
MQSYIVRRVCSAVLVLFMVSIIVFVILRIRPEYTAFFCGDFCTTEQEAEIRGRYGLDQPVPVRYADWIGNVMRGDFGRSLYDQDVNHEVAARLPLTFELLVLAALFTAVLGISLGLSSAFFANSLFDHAVRATSIAGLSIPYFFLAVMALLIPAAYWGYEPPFSHSSFHHDTWANLRQFVPPALILALAPASVVTRTTRAAFVAILRQDYVRVARAKGLSWRAITIHHAFRNAATRAMTALSGTTPFLLSAAIIVEQVFGLKGVALYLYESALRRDYPVLGTLVLYAAVVIVAVNLLVNIACVFLDPRLLSTGAMPDNRARDIVLRGSTVI